MCQKLVEKVLPEPAAAPTTVPETHNRKCCLVHISIGLDVILTKIELPHTHTHTHTNTPIHIHWNVSAKMPKLVTEQLLITQKLNITLQKKIQFEQHETSLARLMHDMCLYDLK